MSRLSRAALFAVALPYAALAQTAPVQQAIPPQQTPVVPLTYQEPLSRPAIQTVQEQLRSQGSYGGAVTGIWDTDSEAALTQYQQTHGLQPTGQLNLATALLLGLNPAQLLDATAATVQPPTAAPPPTASAPAPAPAAPPPAAGPPAQGSVLSIVAVRNLQSRLRDLGYYTGGVDGQWGPRAEDALRRFQLASGIEVSGRINPQTVSAMGIDPNNLEAPARP